MFLYSKAPYRWSLLKRLIWYFKAAAVNTERDPESDVVNIGRADYMTIT